MLTFYEKWRDFILCKVKHKFYKPSDAYLQGYFSTIENESPYYIIYKLAKEFPKLAYNDIIKLLKTYCKI